jgi:hypothetical protein
MNHKSGVGARRMVAELDGLLIKLLECDSFNAFEGKLDLCYQTETPNQEPNSAIPCH